MVVIRPMGLKDADALRAFIERLSPASRHARFQYVVKEVSPRLLRLLLEVDPRDHVALGAFDGDQLVGEARYARREDPAEADFAIAVDDAWRGRGLAQRLLRDLMQRAGRDGVRRLEGEVLANNEAMLAFAAQEGFRTLPHFEDARLMRVRRDLGEKPPRAPEFSRAAETARFAIAAGIG
ncbi:MAG TPA: GNAT family N-acetyltransferase [Burkholderiales bacterium]|nr:GNAT family N-acetyltransferase [Burkholderiales bacterium]